ncbi:TPA: hypothetical protein HA239_06125 [Candidatus Woesearchaeota archaeon]|nr:hypothetical protein QT06_C0001G1325 [archaeon GW2011_AR15]MBS3104217.1 NAD(+)/NADH kinase [Candidatus Woesearchaeota archaeon]HIH41953.1 hypothetical protein [Candidatus Woesearchaeota archaeon]
MNILVVRPRGFYLETLARLKKVLGGNKYNIVDREDLLGSHYNNIELVIVVGGDGTFLRAGHFNDKIPMFGINPAPGEKEGFFMQADKNDFEEKIKKVLGGKYRLSKLQRLSVLINGKEIEELALNEVYIGDAKPYTMFNYFMKVGKDTEYHRSSGVLIGTASGSHAWLKSAEGKVMKKEERGMQYASRELYKGRLTPGYRLKSGILAEGEKIEIIPDMPAIVVADSVGREYAVKRKDRIIVTTSKHDLNLIELL